MLRWFHEFVVKGDVAQQPARMLVRLGTRVITYRRMLDLQFSLLDEFLPNFTPLYLVDGGFGAYEHEPPVWGK